MFVHPVALTYASAPSAIDPAETPVHMLVSKGCGGALAAYPAQLPFVFSCSRVPCLPGESNTFSGGAPTKSDVLAWSSLGAGLAERLADVGYVALVPDMFWRIERRFERKDESGMADAFAVVQRFGYGAAAGDIEATHRHLLSMPECNGRVGCWVFASAAASRSPPPRPAGWAAAARTPPSATTGRQSTACRPGRPAGVPHPLPLRGQRRFIPRDKIAEVEAAVAGRPGAEVYHYEAGHAFSNWDAPSAYVQTAADVAWGRTLGFLGRHLGPGQQA